MRSALAALTVSLAVACAPHPTSARLVIEDVPGGGIQPQVAVDGQGTVHVVYFSGEAANGDLDYVTRDASGRWSAPVRVNSTPHSAVATASVRGAQMALGRDGRVHVVWNGSAHLHAPARGLPLFYTRWDPASRRFEPQRDLINWAYGNDGGGSIAADDGGRVFAVWHAVLEGTHDATGAVFVTRSSDDGASFTREERATTEGGACACCSMRASVDRRGTLHVVYRAAGNGVDRDVRALALAPTAAAFESVRLDPWRTDLCPLSTMAIADGPRAAVAAWDTDNRIQLADLGASPGAMVRTVPGAGRRKHPVLAFNRQGEMLVAWLDGTAWARGGRVMWQIFDAHGAPAEAGMAGEVPAWGLAAAAPLPDGRFLLLR